MSLSISFLGHTTISVKSESLRLVFDPNFNRQLFNIKRQSPAVFRVDDLNQTQVVLFTSAHHHRLDISSLGYFKQNVQVLVPRGLAKIISTYFEFHLSELKDGATVKFGNTTITALKAKHRGFRKMGFGYPLALNYLVKTPERTILYVGDTSYEGAYFHDLGQKHKIDVACLPVDHVGLDSLAVNRYLKPSQAIQAFEDLGASLMVPHSFGAFNFAGRSFDNVKDELMGEAKRHGVEGRVKNLHPGEFFQL